MPPPNTRAQRVWTVGNCGVSAECINSSRPLITNGLQQAADNRQFAGECNLFWRVAFGRLGSKLPVTAAFASPANRSETSVEASAWQYLPDSSLPHR